MNLVCFYYEMAFKPKMKADCFINVKGFGGRKGKGKTI